MAEDQRVILFFCNAVHILYCIHIGSFRSCIESVFLTLKRIIIMIDDCKSSIEIAIEVIVVHDNLDFISHIGEGTPRQELISGFDHLSVFNALESDHAISLITEPIIGKAVLISGELSFWPCNTEDNSVVVSAAESKICLQRSILFLLVFQRHNRRTGRGNILIS